MDRGVFNDFQTMAVYLSKLRKATCKFHSELLKPFGITHRYAAYIMILSDSEGMTMKQLSEELCVDPANTTRVIATLKEKGLVCDDCKKLGGRKFKVFLTDSGKNLAERLKEDFINSNDNMFAVLTAEEREQFFKLCSKIIEASLKLCD